MTLRSKPATVAALAIIIFTGASFAQTKTPSLESVRLREKKAFEQMSKTPHRATLTIEVRNSESEEWRPYSCFITEYTPGRSYERRCAEPFKEKIQIGRQTYLRMPDGSWQLEKRKAESGNIWKQEPAKVEVERLESETAPKGGLVGFCVSSQTTTQRPSDGRVFEVSASRNVWFDQQGRLVRRESLRFSEIPSAGRFSRTIYVYEYDDSIRIDVPVIVEQ